MVAGRYACHLHEVEQLYDNACIAAGTLDDPRVLMSRLNKAGASFAASTLRIEDWISGSMSGWVMPGGPRDVHLPGCRLRLRGAPRSRETSWLAACETQPDDALTNVSTRYSHAFTLLAVPRTATFEAKGEYRGGDAPLQKAG